MVLTSGSTAHFPKKIGTWYTIVTNSLIADSSNNYIGKLRIVVLFMSRQGRRPKDALKLVKLKSNIAY